MENGCGALSRPLEDFQEDVLTGLIVERLVHRHLHPMTLFSNFLMPVMVPLFLLNWTLGRRTAYTARLPSSMTPVTAVQMLNGDTVCKSYQLDLNVWNNPNA